MAQGGQTSDGDGRDGGGHAECTHRLVLCGLFLVAREHACGLRAQHRGQTARESMLRGTPLSAPLGLQRRVAFPPCTAGSPPNIKTSQQRLLKAALVLEQAATLRPALPGNAPVALLANPFRQLPIASRSRHLGAASPG